MPTQFTLLSRYVNRVFNNSPARSIVNTAAAANGWQLSAGRDTFVMYSVLISGTATIGVPVAGNVLLEICATNSVVAADWQEIGRVGLSQAITVAAALQSIITHGAQVFGIVPSGWFVRLRSSNVVGTPTYSFVSGQEVVT